MAVTVDNSLTVAPTGLVSTNSQVALAPIDTISWQSLSYTIKVITDSVDWEVFGANLADFTDEVTVQAEATVAAAAASSYAIAQAVFRYYRVKITSAVADTPGTATVVGVAKPS